MDVTEVDSLEHLPEDPADGVLVKTSRRALVEVIEHCVVDKLEDKVEVFLATEHFDQIHQILMP